MSSISIDGRARLRAAFAAGASLAALTLWATPVLAQNEPQPEIPGEETPAPAASDASGGNTILVTGSRIARRDYTATSPIVTVDAALLEQSSSINLEANLNKLPQLAPALTQFGPPEGRGDINSTATNTPGATTVSLRQLGSNRNLVLMDGRRGTPVNGTGVIDINTIPSAAIERVEIITGGASSTYGADAVGGVVNFILKDNFEGSPPDAQYGISQRGDGAEYRISGLFGASTGDGRGNVMLGVEHYDREEVKQFSRPWYVDLYSSPDTCRQHDLRVRAGLFPVPDRCPGRRRAAATRIRPRSTPCSGPRARPPCRTAPARHSTSRSPAASTSTPTTRCSSTPRSAPARPTRR
jgi:outer membrane receptor protein involved in Fe transport